MTISQTIIDFTHKCLQQGDLLELDLTYVQNQLLRIFHLKELDQVDPSANLAQLDRLDLLDQLLDHAVDLDLIEDNSSNRDVLGAEIMDLVTPLPSQVNAKFWDLHRLSPKLATDYFYQTSLQNNYIKSREIAQNIYFSHQTDFGDLELTINLSKPEKTSKEIEEAKNNPSDYPVNLLSYQNEGYRGHVGHPGRSNHRLIRLTLDNGEQWGFQYSPYAYYNEHSIFLSMAHRPMKVGKQTVVNLLNILEEFPHYFVGSNAGLPIVGGSILAHDHYQAGRHQFALDTAPSIYDFTLKGVQASIVNWPMSVIRLKDPDRNKLTQAAQVVFQEWESYSNEDLSIQAFTGETPHNAITPLTRKDGIDFVVDLVLRNNRTDKTYPDGIFHPHPEVQHIKQENIGLIEVLGLAVLPPRLKGELQEVRDYLLGQTGQVATIHQAWAESLKEKYGILSPEEVDGVVQAEVGEKFLQVLKDAGVFKLDQAGQAAFKAFADDLAQHEWRSQAKIKRMKVSLWKLWPLIHQTRPWPWP